MQLVQFAKKGDDEQGRGKCKCARVQGVISSASPLAPGQHSSSEDEVTL